MSDGYTYDRADAVRIESDEQGFELHIETTMHGTIVLNIHGVVFDLYGEVANKVLPYVAEAQAARREYDSGVADDPKMQPILDRIKGRPQDVRGEPLDEPRKLTVLDTIYGHEQDPEPGEVR